jgi:uncharacterized protein
VFVRLAHPHNKPNFRSRFSSGSFHFLWLAVIGLAFAGCKKKEPSTAAPSQVHAITREMLRTAASVVREPGSIESRLQFDGVHADRPDRIIILLHANASDQSRREIVSRLTQALDRIATSSHLTRDTSNTAETVKRLDYRRQGLLTQTIEIGARRAATEPSPSVSFPHRAGSARLAIILDDLGSDRAAADSILALPYPLTLSVLPNHSHSTEIAEEARRRGHQVMLHLPMQSLGNEKPEAEELHPGMSAESVSSLVDQFLRAVPGATGVNNHQGSQSTADTQLMEELMPVLRDRGLFYIDSRTTAATVAYEEAQQTGVKSAFRNVPFLDDVAEVGAVRKQLQLALAGAREKGEAVAIGHPHPATLQALKEVLPQAKATGVRLVFASELAR